MSIDLQFLSKMIAINKNVVNKVDDLSSSVLAVILPTV